MSDSREEAEDLVQETFARVLQRPRFLHCEDDIGYLLRVLRNTSVSGRTSDTLWTDVDAETATEIALWSMMSTGRANLSVGPTATSSRTNRRSGRR